MKTLNPQPNIGATRFVQFLADYAPWIVPIAIVSMVLVILVPMPPMLMDLLITLNLAMSIVVLLTTLGVRSPLDFSVFPSLLLGVTLYRVVLNVASTRLILTADAPSADEASAVAGRVIEAFGNFVAGGSVVVGAIIFLILIIVQFVVITRGATRISEVAARFALDGLPGKQMAIDADVNAGVIDEAEARRRRQEIAREADFYGAMDGASKFVRGDAIAGVAITVINIVGGLAIGVLQKGWPVGQTMRVFTVLTIGDGLVSQVPAFVVALAAGLIVTRSGSKVDLGQELTAQLSAQPIALALAAIFIAGLAFMGLPMLPMLLIGGGFGLMAYFVYRGGQSAQAEEPPLPPKPQETPVEKLLAVDTLEVEIGYGLVRLVDVAHGGNLLDRISTLRRGLAVELGLVIPPVRVHDNTQLPPHGYSIRLRGNRVCEGTIHPGRWLAIDTGGVAPGAGPLEGEAIHDPAMGLPARWVDVAARSDAEAAGYTVVDAPGVLIAHLTEIVKAHAAELLSREETNRLIAQLREKAPKLVEEVIGPQVKPAELQRVLQNLLRERVPIRDLETIVETLGDWSQRTRDPQMLTEYARHALRRTICGQYARHEPGGENPRLSCVTIDPSGEELVESYIERGQGGTTMTMPPAVAEAFTAAVLTQLRRLVESGLHPVVLASPSVRGAVRELLEPRMPNIAVLGYNEVGREVQVQSLGLVRIEPSPADGTPDIHVNRLQGVLN